MITEGGGYHDGKGGAGCGGCALVGEGKKYLGKELVFHCISILGTSLAIAI